MLLCCFAVYQVALVRLSMEHLGVIFLALTVDFMALSFQGWAKFVFYSALRQAEATWMSIAVSAARLAAMGDEHEIRILLAREIDAALAMLPEDVPAPEELDA